MLEANRSTTTPAGSLSRHTNATRRDRATSALILGVAAMAWFGWSQEGPPAGWVLPLRVGSGFGLLVAALAAIVVWRCRHGASAMADPRVRRVYYRVIGIEVAAIAVGATALGIIGRSSYLAPWTLFVVGLHFVPLSRLFGDRSLTHAGGLLVAVSAVSVTAGLIWTVTPSAVAGGGGGLILLVFAAWSLVRHRRVWS